MTYKGKNRSCSQGGLGSLSSENPHSRRVYFLFLITLGLFGAVVFRLYFLQAISYSDYKLLAKDQHSVFQKLFPKRGEIYLREKDGVFPVAINREAKMAYAVPRDIENVEEAADFLSSALGLNREEIKRKISDKEDVYEALKHRLSDEEIGKIRERKIKGIELLPETYRYYPGKELSSTVLGFVGWKEDELVGRYGLEAYFEESLKGKMGQISQNRDASGRWITIGKRDLEEAKDGDSLVLTIDHIVQFETEKVLEGAVRQYEADSGTMLVIEPGSGKILSMATYPNFDPNDYSKVEDIAVFRNLAVSSAYESGSVFKPITMAAALDSGKVTPETTYVDTGVVNEAGYAIKNSDFKSYGKQTMTQVLENSLNTGVIFAEQQIGNKNFSDYIKRFGFGELTGVETLGESPGNINNLKNLKSDIQFFTASFGQGI
ncbi:MAG: peptidoglycan D,D-transpeptidase FtsI family protein, partial [Patescibacteria group bacterium]